MTRYTLARSFTIEERRYDGVILNYEEGTTLSNGSFKHNGFGDNVEAETASRQVKWERIASSHSN